MHLRQPSFDPGVVSFLWGLLFTVYIWAFMLAVGISNAMAVVVAVVCGVGVFLLVRIYGEEDLRRRRRRRRGA